MKSLASIFAAAALFLAACGQKPAEGNAAAATTTTTPAATTQPAANPQPAAADSKTLLQGKWASAEPGSGMEFTATNMNAIADGNILTGSAYEYDPACKTCGGKGAQDAGFGCIVEHGEQDWCYVITKLSATELEYKMDNGKGSAISLTRMK